MKSVGRFAPSPSGLLHFGSFVTALASYLQAKSQQGEWLVRIEDIDPPREVSGASTHILTTLEKLGLYWDRDTLFQSSRSERYQHVVHSLIDNKRAYYCDCTRQRIQSLPNHIYDNHCRNRDLKPSPNHPMSIKIMQMQPVNHFIDNIRGHQTVTNTEAIEDFVIYRKDCLFAYNLAVVIDDHDQGVTEIVRGADLLSVTTKQISLYQLFDFKLPSYYHLPLVLNKNQKKLSKQNHAPPINLDDIPKLTIDALQFLGQVTPLDWRDANQEQLLHWAIMNWNINSVPNKDKCLEISKTTLF